MKKRILSLLLAIVLVLGMVPTAVFAAEETGITVYMTVFNKGEFCKDKNSNVMWRKPVTVLDTDADGKYSLDEALAAAHAAYYAGGVDGYATQLNGAFGSKSVTTLWGQDAEASGYYRNHAITNAVDQEYLSEGDQVTAFLYYDGANWSDRYSFFTEASKTVAVGTEFELTLNYSGYDSLWNPATLPVATAPIGVYNMTDGSYSVPASLKGENIWGTIYAKAATDIKGVAKLSFTEPGTYYVTAQYNSSNYSTYTDELGTVPNYLVPPVCVVTVVGAAPVFSKDLSTAEVSYKVGDQAASLSVEASAPDGGAVTYQWYSASDAESEGTAIDGATESSYTPSTETAGTAYYYVVASNTAKHTAASSRTPVKVAEEELGELEALSFKTTLTNKPDYPLTLKKENIGSVEKYVLQVPDQAFDNNLELVISQPEGSAKKLTVRYDSYLMSNYPGNGESIPGVEAVKSADDGSEIRISDWKLSWLGIDWSKEINITIGEGDDAHSYSVEIRPFLTIGNLFVKETSGNKNNRPLESAKLYGGTGAPIIGEHEFSCEVVRNSEVEVSPNLAQAVSKFAIIKLNGEEARSVKYTAGEEDTKVIEFELTCEGFVPVTGTLTLLTVDQDQFPVLGDMVWVNKTTGVTLVNPKTANIKPAITQYDDVTLTIETEETGDDLVWTWESRLPTSITSETNVITIDTTNPAVNMYTVKLSRTVNGRVYTTSLKTPLFTLTALKLNTPTFKQQPISAEYTVGQTAIPLVGQVNFVMGGKCSTQWYVNDIESTIGGTPVDATSTGPQYVSYLVPDTTQPGTRYYYLGAVASQGEVVSAEGYSSIAKITVNPIELSLKGNGTEEEPYEIYTIDDLRLINQQVKNGTSFANMYLKLMADITLSADWQPIGALAEGATEAANGINIRPFSGNFDGNNKTITVAQGGLPLFGYVREATIKNLTIYGPQIAGYGLINNYTVDYGVDGDYQTGVPATALIDNVTLKRGTQTLRSGFVGGYASGGNTITISNCTVEAGVTIGYDKKQSGIGSFAGSFNGTLINCVSEADVYGDRNVGGLVGQKGQSMGSCLVQNSGFCGSITATENRVGGIIGSGYDGSGTAPNTPVVSILNCYVDAAIIGADQVGGILGAEPGCEDCFDNGAGYIQDNVFYGSITATGESAGAIVGFFKSFNEYQGVKNCYYLNNCGANKAIGSIEILYPNVEAPEAGCTFATAVEMQEGIIAEKLNASDTSYHNWVTGKNGPVHSDAPIAYKLEASGEYKTTYYLGEELDLDGLALTATWSDNSTTTPALEDVKITCFDPNVRGEQTVTLTYGSASTRIQVTVLKKAEENETITVSFSLLGDHRHTAGETEVHTYADGNLETWVTETQYEVGVNATVWDVLRKVLADNDMTCVNPTGNYVESITRKGVTIGEMTNGESSGWMYILNGVHTSNGVAQQYLEEGDVITFHYTDDFTREAPIGEDQKVKAVIAEIDAIGEVTIDSKEAIEAARIAFEALTDSQKKQVTNYDVLVAAEKAYADLVADAADREAAKAVADLIDAIGQVTKDSKEAIEAARAAYDDLTDVQKALVGNVQALVDAEKALEALMKPEANADLRHAYETTGKYLQGQTPITGSVGGEWLVLGLARSELGMTDAQLAAYKEAVFRFVRESINENEQLHNTKSTENARIIVALTALGMDPTDVEGHNLLEGLTDLNYLKKQGLNGPIWALIAFDTKGYEIPGELTREDLIHEILGRQLSGGGWSRSSSGTDVDVDITAMALYALAPYVESNSQVKAAVEAALDCLSAMQNENGGFAYGGEGKNAESCAQVITALSVLGIDADSDPRFIKGEGETAKSVIDAFLGFYVEGGGFRHNGEKLDQMATEQAFYAMAAYYRNLNGKKTLFDMRDVGTEKPGETVDKSALEAAAAAAEKLNKADYTEDSWKELEAALEHAKAVLAAVNATQAQVDEEVTKLTAAVAALVKASRPTEPTVPTEPEPTDPKPTDPKPTDPNEPPKTGDETPVALLTTLMTVSCLGIAALYLFGLKKKGKYER